MQRGELTLDKLEANHLFRLYSVPQNQNTPLFNKLHNASKYAEEQVTVELSEQEVETLLDALAAPGENEVADSARAKLRSFYSILRG